MKRFHLVEIEDQPWCPASIRDGATDYLQYIQSKMQPYRAIAPRLAKAIQITGADQIIDLCSGAGGPWVDLLPYVSANLDRPVPILLTDRYPNLSAWQRLNDQSEGIFQFVNNPVDAVQVPQNLTGFRTLFSGFHHFTPEEAARILQDTTSKGQGIGIFEATERKAPAMVGMLFVPLIVALVTPAIHPFRWSRLFWTYLVPAIPLIGLFDGFVSCLRTYTLEELREMVKPLASYTWEIGQERVVGMPVKVTYLIGYPNKDTTIQIP
jgi:hypothetical protein